MLDRDQLDPSSFLARQLHIAALSTKGRIVISRIITAIARCSRIEPNHKDRVSEYERLDQVAFEIMNFCKVEAVHLCWIYPGDRLLSLPNVDCTTFLHPANLYWVLGDEEVVRPALHQPVPRSSQARPSSSSQPPL